MAMAAAPPRVPHVTGCSKEPLHITRTVQQIMDNILFHRIPPQTVLAFIHVIEKAEQYFAVKDLVRGLPVVKEQKFVPDYVRDDICNKLENDEKFDKLGHEEILHALNVVDLEVQPQNASRNFRGKKPNPNRVALTPDERLDNYLDAPICHLVFEARTKGRVLDVDPTVELKKLRNASFPFYGPFDVDIWDQGPFDVCDRRFKEFTLTFSGNTLDKEDIKAKLSKCGKIEHVKLKSLKKLAHVTFRDLAGATEAILLVVKGLLDLGGEPANLILTPSNLLHYCFAYPPRIIHSDEGQTELQASCSKYVQNAALHIQAAAAAEESFEEVLDELLREAVCRYIVLVKGQAKRRDDEKSKRRAR